MKSKPMSASRLAEAAVLAAMYAALTVLQQLILPGSASLTVQLRLSEAMTLLSVFMPSAVPGLTLGCLIANALGCAAMPVDILFGSLGTLLSCLAVRLTGGIRFKGLPVVSAAMPALFNGLIIGAELELFYIEGGFELIGFLWQFLCVAVGELIVCTAVGLPLFRYFERHLGKRRK